jgi:hypothetical protein
MRTVFTMTVAGTLLAATIAGAVPYNRVYLVPALKKCESVASACIPRQFESRYTFDAIVLRTPATRYMPAGKPSLYLEIRGVRDPDGAPVNGTLTVRVLSGRVSLPTLGTFPDDFSLTQVAPIAVPVKNGRNRRFPYQANPQPPAGTIVNGGAVEVYDPEGKLLAVTGSQSKP